MENPMADSEVFEFLNKQNKSMIKCIEWGDSQISAKRLVIENEKRIKLEQIALIQKQISDLDDELNKLILYHRNLQASKYARQKQKRYERYPQLQMWEQEEADKERRAKRVEEIIAKKGLV